MDNLSPAASAPNDESIPQSRAASVVITIDPLKAAGQVGEILKARKTERDNIFNGVLAVAGYIATAGIVVIAVALAVDTLGMFEVGLGMLYYVLAAGYCIGESGVVLMTTLPPETFNFNIALDDRRGARRAMTIVLMLLTGMQGMGFPHISGLGSLGFLVKLIWDESVAGCCRCGAHKKQHGVTGFHDEQGRRVHNPTDAGCGARFRPRLTDMMCLCFMGVQGLHYGGKYIFFFGPCHAAAQVPGMAANNSATSSDDAIWTAPADASSLHNRTALGNANSTPIVCPGGYSFR